ncbi:putative ribonuclease H-like domain-containing protein [Tanacetum coccineum]
MPDEACKEAKVLEKEKVSRKDYERKSVTQEKKEEVPKEPTAKRKKSILGKNKEDQKLEMFEKDELKGFLDGFSRVETPIRLNPYQLRTMIGVHMLTERSILSQRDVVNDVEYTDGDDYSRFSWVFFLATKDETSGILKSFITGVENLIDQKVKIIRCDNGTEFKNKEMNQFCERKCIKREFSVVRTPQQNGVAERKNKTLIEAARTIQADSKLLTTFWAEVVNIACYVQNRVLVTKPHNKTPYELFLGRKPALGSMRPFGCPVIILNTIDHLGKFDGKAVKDSLLGSGPNWLFDIDALTKSNYKPVVVRNQSNGNAGTKACDDAGKARMETIPGKDYILLPLWNADSPFSQNSKSSPDVGFKPSTYDEKKKDADVNSTNNVYTVSSLVKTVSSPVNAVDIPDDLNMPPLEDIVYSDDDEDVGAEADMNNLDAFMLVSPIPTTRVHKDYPVEQIIGDLNSTPQTRKMSKNLEEYEFKNPKRLVAQGYTQEEGIDYDEVFSPVARIETIRLFLAYASFKDFVVYQMKVKSAFLYGKIEEEVYVCQPPGFEDPNFPDRVYKVEKALYGLHQAPRAWYETLSTYLLDNEFQKGKINKTLFIKRYKGDILLVHVYVDEIIFGTTNKKLCIAFEKLMQEKFQMSSMGELTFFLGLQVQQTKDGIFISQDKYVGEILKKFRFTKVKTASTQMETQKPLLKDEDGEKVDVHMYRSMIGSLMYLASLRPDIMFAVCACARYQVNLIVSHLHAVKRIFKYLKGQQKLGLWYPKDSPFDLVAYINSDYARTNLDKKYTTGCCQFFGCRLISWQCKKETVVANSTTEAGYVAASSCCGQVTTINGEAQLHAWVDGKKIIITESTVRRDHQLEDAEDEAVYKELDDSLVRAATTASSLKAERDSGNIIKTRSKATPNEVGSQGTTSGGGPRCQDTMGDTIAQTRFENVSKTSNDSLLVGVNTPRSDEDSMKLKELMEFCTKLQQRVLDLENTKTAQAQEITSLKLRVKKLEKKGGSRTHKLKRLYKVGRSARVISSDEASLGDQEDASKQGRKIDDIDKDVEITLVDETQGRFGDDLMFDTGVLDDEEVFTGQDMAEKEINVAKKEVSTADPVTTARKVVTTASVEISIVSPTKTIIADDLTLAQNLIEIRSAKPKVKGVVIEEQDTDYQMAQQMQAEQQEILSIEEKSKLFVNLDARKNFAAMRAQENRNKPPTKAQKRKTMSTYLKNSWIQAQSIEEQKL